MAEPHAICPMFAVPNEVLYHIAQHLPQLSLIALQTTCRAFHLPLRSLLISKHKNDILVFAAENNLLNLLTTCLSAGAEITYRGRSTWHGKHNGETVLHRAAVGGHTEIITELLRHSPPLEDRGGHDQTPLHSAASGGHQEAVDLLLHAGADPNSRGRCDTSLLFSAIGSNLIPTATAFIGQMGGRELIEAIKCERLVITQLMFARGITATSPCFLRAAASTTVDFVKLCLDHGSAINQVHPTHKSTALSVAVAYGKLEVAEFLIAQGADPNLGPKKYRPVIVAAYNGKTEMVKLLLAHGVDLTVLRNPYADVLVSACARSTPELVALLLDADQGLAVDGNNDDLRKPGPLHVAAQCGNAGVIKLLVERGAKVNARRGPKFETPLHWAARAGRREAVEALLEVGADTTLQCNGATPLLMSNRSWGSVEGKGKIMASLVKGGADINELGSKSRSVVSGILAKEKLTREKEHQRLLAEKGEQRKKEQEAEEKLARSKMIVVLKVRTPALIE